MWLPIVIALAKMTADRMNIMGEALFKIVMSFLIKHCPQKPARIDTPIRYKAATEKGKKKNMMGFTFKLYIIIII